MKKILILGGGTAGTMTANKLRKALPVGDWAVTVVDADDNHRYQPGYLFMPFGTYTPSQVTKSRRKYLNKGVSLVYGEIDKVEADANAVLLTDGQRLTYDYLIIATGVTPRPDQTPGMVDDMGGSVHEFYSYKGSTALAEKLKTWPGGKLVIHITEMPIKCPVAPLEFAFLADAFFKDKGMRDKVELTYVTPLDAAFTKPIAAEAFGNTLEEKGITVVPDFMIESVDAENKKIVAYDETEVPYDLLVTIPLNMGADYVARSGLGNDLNLVPVDKFTQQAKAYAEHLRARRRQRHPRLQGRVGRALRGRHLPRQLPAAPRGQGDDPQVRRARQLLHRDRWRQGDAHRLQLRHRAPPRQVPVRRRRPHGPAQGGPPQPHRQARLPLGVLEHADARAPAADPAA